MASNTTTALPLHREKLDPRIIPNRIHALLYSTALLTLFYRHFLTLLHTTKLFFFTLSCLMLLADVVLAFMWLTSQGFRWRPLRRKAFPENLSVVIGDDDGKLPKLDVFICTADPYKEPPMNVVNTALSVMAFDYPPEKVTVYVSDDGGSELTLFAFMEAAKFAKHWLPFCRKSKIQNRCPDIYFKSDHSHIGDNDLRDMYKNEIKFRVNCAVEKGGVSLDFLPSEEERKIFEKYYWTHDFSRQDHPSIIQVLLDSENDKDIDGQRMPNLVYVSREKRSNSPHNFKAGALNVLLRVSSEMSNAPVILTLDCDMHSNDPTSAKQALCYLLEPSREASRVAYVQFPQLFPGLNKGDIYGCELKRMFQINPLGMDGLSGPDYFGTGCFFRRQAFHGPPYSAPLWGMDDMAVEFGPWCSKHVLEAAYKVAECTYENDTIWGKQLGFRYGSLVEDFFTGYQLACQGWRSIFCNPERAAFLCDAPVNLEDNLGQIKRWSVGLLEVVFSKYNPLVFSARALGLPMCSCYAYYTHWPIYTIPVTIYGMLPPLALLNQIQLFPKFGDPWVCLHLYLFFAAYGQDLLDFIIEKGSIKRWWSDQRMWMIRGTSCFLIAFLDFSLQLMGISGVGFNVTSKVVDDGQNKRYEKEMFEFGVPSPLFVTLGAFSLINLMALVMGLAMSIKVGSLNEMMLQILMAGFVAMNGWPVYEAMVLRSDKGRMPMKITILSLVIALVLCMVFYFLVQF